MLDSVLKVTGLIVRQHTYLEGEHDDVIANFCSSVDLREEGALRKARKAIIEFTQAGEI